jgi:hypothetical protein
MWLVEVTTMISSTAAPTSWRTGCQIIGSRPTGSRCLLVISVSGESRVPSPPARMTPFIAGFAPPLMLPPYYAGTAGFASARGRASIGA